MEAAAETTNKQKQHDVEGEKVNNKVKRSNSQSEKERQRERDRRATRVKNSVSIVWEGVFYLNFFGVLGYQFSLWGEEIANYSATGKCVKGIFTFFIC